MSVSAPLARRALALAVTATMLAELPACDAGRSTGPWLNGGAVFARSASVPAPTSVAAVPELSTRIGVSWSNATTKQDDVRVERSLNGGASWSALSLLPGTAGFIDDDGRTPEQRACYRVVAIWLKTESVPSPSDCATPPAAPTNVTATAIDDQHADVAWTDASAVESTYVVIRRVVSAYSVEMRVAELPANSTHYRDATVPVPGVYAYRVQATGHGGYGTPSAAALAYVGVAPPPSAPTGMNAVAISSNIVGLTWTDASTTEAGFKLQRASSVNGPWTQFIATGANVTNWSDALPTEQLACYRVIAFNTSGDSPPSNVDCAALLKAPSNLAVTQRDAQSVQLDWTSTSTLATTIEIARGTSTSGPFTIVGTVAATARSYRDTPPVDVQWWYRVRTRRDDDISDGYTMASGVVATTPPIAATDPLSYPMSSTSIHVVWTDQAANETGYRVEKSTDGGATWSAAGSVPTVSGYWGEWSDASAATEHVACYRAIAFNALGDSPPTAATCTAPPARVTGLSASKIDATTVELTWSDNSSVEDGFVILRNTNPFDVDFEEIGNVDANVTTFRDIAFPQGAFAAYIVEPTRGLGVGDPSDEVGVNDYPTSPLIATVALSPAIRSKLLLRSQTLHRAASRRHP